MIFEVYVFVRNNVLTLYAGKKVGDLALVWVSQEQGDAQVVGFIEGAPPAPMANLTNKPSYAGATNVSFTAPISLSYKYQTGSDGSTANKGNGGATGSYDPSMAKAPNKPTSVSTDRLDAISGADGGGGATIYTVNQGGNTVTFNQADSGKTTVTTGPQDPPNGAGGSTGFGFKLGPVLAVFGIGLKSDITPQSRSGGGDHCQPRRWGWQHLAADCLREASTKATGTR